MIDYESIKRCADCKHINSDGWTCEFGKHSEKPAYYSKTCDQFEQSEQRYGTRTKKQTIKHD